MASAIQAPIGATGPRTPEGKAISSQNAVSHGLTSERTVLAHENQEEYNGLLTALKNDFHPDGEHEAILVCRMAAAQWKIDRAGRIENALFELMMSAQGATVSDLRAEIPPARAGDPARRVVRDSVMESDDKTNSSPETRMARAMMNRAGDPLNALQRYISSLERSYDRAHRELIFGRKSSKFARPNTLGSQLAAIRKGREIRVAQASACKVPASTFEPGESRPRAALRL